MARIVPDVLRDPSHALPVTAMANPETAAAFSRDGPFFHLWQRPIKLVVAV
ncbi:MAG: hypothetical protein IPL65_19345 [Lewinellaceae bacterium]|nr:hypothetical protein [Lewinellaceae bacterium]